MAHRVSTRWLRATLVASLLALAATPLVVSDSYSIIEHTLSESGAQGIEGAWLFRLGVVLAAGSVLILTVTAHSVWGSAGTWWLRIYGLALIPATVFSEAPWDGRPHDEITAFLHTVFTFVAGSAFILGVISVSKSRPRHSLVISGFDWVVVGAVVVIPLTMMVAGGDGLLQRLLVFLGYLWLIVEATRIIKVQPVSADRPADDQQIRVVSVQARRMAQNSAMPAQSRFLWRVALPVIRGLGRTFFSLRVEREAALPPPPFVVAANHYSHFDPPVIAAALGMPVRYLALDDLFGVNSLLDWLLLGFGAIPIPRHRLPIRGVRVALAALQANEIVGVFPEATRVSHWGTLTPKRGAAWLAMRAKVPLVPVAVIGTGRVFGLDNRLRRARSRVVVGRAIQPEQTDAAALTRLWAEWITAQISRHPDSELSGPPRSSLRSPI